MERLKPVIKVCGMKYPENIRDVLALKPDMIGFIFYASSKRYVGSGFEMNIPENPYVRKVGVFVNESTAIIERIVKNYHLDILQLHGRETPDQCLELKHSGVQIIKAFGMGENFNWKITEPYQHVADYLLFDTKTPAYGGSGKHFDWNLLADYPYPTSFLLSGGLRPQDAEALKTFNHPRCVGFDVNSGFETEPGMKDVPKLKKFIEYLRS